MGIFDFLFKKSSKDEQEPVKLISRTQGQVTPSFIVMQDAESAANKRLLGMFLEC